MIVTKIIYRGTCDFCGGTFFYEDDDTGWYKSQDQLNQAMREKGWSHKSKIICSDCLEEIEKESRKDEAIRCASSKEDEQIKKEEQNDFHQFDPVKIETEEKGE